VHVHLKHFAQSPIIGTKIIPKLEKKVNNSDSSKPFTIGFVSPFRNQVKLLKEQFSSAGFVTDTVHKFQGKEKTAIVMSTVSDGKRPNNFLNDPNLINVAVSRAQEILYVIASSMLLEQKDSLLNDLAKYNAYYCGKGIKDTSVYSIFDLMFEEYADALKSLKSRLQKISNFESENIVGTIIGGICENKNGLLKFHHNYALRNVLNTLSITDTDDLKFVENENTHCDFVLFDALDKKIRLVVEVDGMQHNKAIQKARDERKDRLLRDARIKILRLPTEKIMTEDDCRKEIEEALSLKVDKFYNSKIGFANKSRIKFLEKRTDDKRRIATKTHQTNYINIMKMLPMKTQIGEETPKKQ
jgi:very-short-patch-repair endonuclease